MIRDQPSRLATTMPSAARLDERRLARLIDAGRGLLSELDLDVVLERLLETAADLTGARYVALGILDDERRELARFMTRGVDEATRRAIGELPRGRGILGVLIDDPRPLRLVDVGDHPRSYGFPPGHPPMRTFLGVPIIIRGEAWGNLYLAEKAEGAPFGGGDEAAVVVLADWAAIAIENARLYRDVAARREELERAVRRIQATAAIARAVGGETEIDRILELVVKRARALVDAHDVLIMLRDRDDLAIVAAAGRVRRDGHGRVPLSESTAGEVLAEGRSRRIEDAARQLRIPPERLGLGHATTALLVPLAGARGPRRVRSSRRRRRVHGGRRGAARGLRRAGRDRRGHGQVGRGRPPAAITRGGRGRATPLGARAP
jgi:GAF domain-containing protein